MTQKIGIIYSSVDGQTKKICEKLCAHFNDQKIEVELYSIETFNEDILEFHTLIIGASIRYGKHHKKVYEFIQKNIIILNQITTLFSLLTLLQEKKIKILLIQTLILLSF